VEDAKGIGYNLPYELRKVKLPADVSPDDVERLARTHKTSVFEYALGRGWLGLQRRMEELPRSPDGRFLSRHVVDSPPEEPQKPRRHSMEAGGR